MSPSAIGWIAAAVLGPIGAVLMMKYRRPAESGQTQRHPRLTGWAYLVGGLLFILLGIVLPKHASERWSGLLLILAGVGLLVGAYYAFRYRLTATHESIVIQDPFRGTITINRQNSTWSHAGRSRGQKITRFTLHDGRTVEVRSPLFDIRTYTRSHRPPR